MLSLGLRFQSGRETLRKLFYLWLLVTQAILLVTFTVLIPALPETVDFVGTRGLVTFQSFLIPPTLLVSLTPDVRRACLQKGVKFIPPSASLPPSLSLFATRKSSALYCEQEAGEGGS